MLENDYVFEITNEEFHLIADFVYHEFGIHFPETKKGLIESRLASIVRKRGLNTISEYLDAVQKDTTGSLLQEMMNKLTTNHSYFFREPILLNYFKNEGFSNLGIKPASPFNLRIWSAGCSEGQEPYSLGILIDEYCQGQGIVNAPIILATDISERALTKAVNGIYSKKEIEESVSHIHQIKYFNKDKDSFQIKNSIRQLILFKKLNLNADSYPFKSKFDIIFCRNVMIYFDEASKRKIIQNFSRYLKPNGYLVVGSSESISNLTTQFRRITNSIYRKIN